MAFCVQVQDGVLVDQSAPAVAECEAVVMTGQEWATSLAVRSASPFEPELAAQFFSASFVGVLFCFFAAKSAGVVLGMIRKH